MSSNLYYASSGISLRPGSPHGCPKTESRTSLRPQTQSLQSHQVFNVDLPQATSSPTRLGAKSRSLDDSLSDFSRSMSCDDGSIGRALKVYNECGLYALDDTPQDDSTQRTYSDESSLGFTDSLDLDGSALELPLPLKPAHTHPASRIYFSPPGLGDVSELQQPTLFESGTLERASSPQTLTPEADLPGIYQSTWATCPTPPPTSPLPCSSSLSDYLVCHGFDLDAPLVLKAHLPTLRPVAKLESLEGLVEQEMDSELLAEVPPTIEVQQSAEMGVCDSIGIATNPEMRQSIDPLPTQQCEDKEPELEVVGKITPSEEPLHHGDELVDLDPVADFISHLEPTQYVYLGPAELPPFSRNPPRSSCSLPRKRSLPRWWCLSSFVPVPSTEPSPPSPQEHNLTKTRAHKPPLLRRRRLSEPVSLAGLASAPLVIPARTPPTILAPTPPAAPATSFPQSPFYQLPAYAHSSASSLASVQSGHSYLRSVFVPKTKTKTRPESLHSYTSERKRNLLAAFKLRRKNLHEGEEEEKKPRTGQWLKKFAKLPKKHAKRLLAILKGTADARELSWSDFTKIMAELGFTQQFVEGEGNTVQFNPPDPQDPCISFVVEKGSYIGMLSIMRKKLAETYGWTSEQIIAAIGSD